MPFISGRWEKDRHQRLPGGFPDPLRIAYNQLLTPTNSPTVIAASSMESQGHPSFSDVIDAIGMGPFQSRLALVCGLVSGYYCELSGVLVNVGLQLLIVLPVDRLAFRLV